MQSQSQLLMSTFSHIFTCNCVRTSHAHFHSLFQLFALFPARMEALAPNQIPAHVLWDGAGLHAVKVSMTECTFLSGEYVCTHAQDACAYNFCCDTLLRCQWVPSCNVQSECLANPNQHFNWHILHDSIYLCEQRIFFIHSFV